LGGPSAGLLVITTAWTGCRWGELAGLQRDHLPPFLVALLRKHFATTPGEFVFTSPLGYRLRRSTFDRRVFRPAVDGHLRKGRPTGYPPGCAGPAS
jgi:hypothetical protein